MIATPSKARPEGDTLPCKVRIRLSCLIPPKTRGRVNGRSKSHLERVRTYRYSLDSRRQGFEKWTHTTYTKSVLFQLLRTGMIHGADPHIVHARLISLGLVQVSELVLGQRWNFTFSTSSKLDTDIPMTVALGSNFRTMAIGISVYHKPFVSQMISNSKGAQEILTCPICTPNAFVAKAISTLSLMITGT